MIGYSKILSQSEHNFMLEIFFLSSRPALMYLLIDIEYNLFEYTVKKI